MIEAHKGFRSWTLVQKHKEHPVIRTGPNTLSFGSVRAIKDIYGHSTKTLKDEGYAVSAGTHFHLADVVDRPEHARKRKVLSAAYALKNLEEWEDKVADKTERLIAQFDKRCTAPLPEGQRPATEDLNVNYRAWTNFFSLDAIADIGLSERLSFLDQGNDRCTAMRADGTTYEVNYRESIYGGHSKQKDLLWNYKNYKLLSKLADIIPYYRRLTKCNRDYDAIVENLSRQRQKRYQAGEKLDDFFQALMESKKGEPNNLPWGEVVAEISIMMNAGSVTTAVAMCNVLYWLLKHPRVWQKLKEEVDAALDADTVVAPYQKVKNLEYLRCVLNESLRIFPPTAHGLGREVPAEGMMVDQEFIPGGTSVSISALVAHRDESVFKDPEAFVPERWLGEEGKSLQSSFLAFSTGARGCIGRNISYLEQTVLLASVIHRYDFALASPDWEIQRVEYMNLLLGDMPVKVWHRIDRPVKA